MENKFTPGPWHVNAIHNGKIVGDETFICPIDKLQINSANNTVATAYRRADVRLIAAAPELLAALRHAYDLLQHGLDAGQDDLAGIHAAIAKAAQS